MTVYIDTETTGLSSSDEVVEIAIIDDHQVLLNTLVKPTHLQSWAEAQAIHGISPDDVADAPTYDNIRSKVRELVAGETVVIYNASYDSMFLGEELRRRPTCSAVCWILPSIMETGMTITKAIAGKS